MTTIINSAAISDRGLSEKRPQNEDSFIELPTHGLFVVCDGVGGAQAGDVASQMATEILGEAFANSRQGGDVEDLMKLAIERANGAIYQMSHDLPQLSTMATTIVALHIADSIATLGHVGDSRIYRIDSKGNLFRETQDHSLVEEEVRAGRMTPEQAAHHPSKNVISRALGAEANVEVDLKTIMFEPNTSFLLCSDGITRHIEDTEIRELLRGGNSPEEICREMKNLCYQRGAEDNLTAVIIRLEGTTGVTDPETDDEENTIATARAPIVGNEAFAQTAATEHDEIPTRDLQIPAVAAESAANESAENSQFSIPASASLETAAPPENIIHASPAAAEADNFRAADDKKYIVEEEKSSGSGKLFAGLILGLLLGAALGAGAYYFLQPPAVSAPEPPKITQMQTSNIPYSAFEDNRRNVDLDPAKYISTNGATADDAEDFYLLGRAFLLTEKYVDAKNNFIKAKEALPQLNGGDKAMLGNEIAIGLSIVDSSFAKTVLQEEKGKMGNAAPQNANTNANSTANVNANTEIKPMNANN